MDLPALPVATVAVVAGRGDLLVDAARGRTRAAHRRAAVVAAAAAGRRLGVRRRSALLRGEEAVVVAVAMETTKILRPAASGMGAAGRPPGLEAAARSPSRRGDLVENRGSRRVSTALSFTLLAFQEATLAL